ncbi:hypothetical protein FDUTEX481_00441 [Tolypothrix sp. PCC 7601]|nr:hypothetical protein FDUTEX481_00441 [Tolypothrix sp. PCC 7601]
MLRQINNLDVTQHCCASTHLSNSFSNWYQHKNKGMVTHTLIDKIVIKLIFT